MRLFNISLLSVALFAITPSVHAGPDFPGMRHIQGAPAIAVWQAVLNELHVPTDAGPGGPVEAAFKLDYVDCKKSNTQLTCAVHNETGTYTASEQTPGTLAGMVTALSGNDHGVYVKTLECFKSPPPINQLICGYWVANAE